MGEMRCKIRRIDAVGSGHAGGTYLRFLTNRILLKRREKKISPCNLAARMT